MYYILIDDQIVRVHPIEFALWMQNASNRIVEWTRINSDIIVSTTFAGMNLCQCETCIEAKDVDNECSPKKILFKTWVFGGCIQGQVETYRTIDGARAGHERWVTKAKLHARGNHDI